MPTSLFTPIPKRNPAEILKELPKAINEAIVIIQQFGMDKDRLISSTSPTDRKKGIRNDWVRSITTQLKELSGTEKKAECEKFLLEKITTLSENKIIMLNNLGDNRLYSDLSESEKAKNSDLSNSVVLHLEGLKQWVQITLALYDSAFLPAEIINNLDLEKFEAKVRNLLPELKKAVNDERWNKKGWGFFSKKTPNGIQKLRILFEKINSENNNTAHDNIKIACDVVNIIQKRLNTVSFFRDKSVQDFYEEILKKLQYITLCEEPAQGLSH